MNLTLSKIMKSVEKKSVQSSCYGLDVMKNSYSKESIYCLMYGVVQISSLDFIILASVKFIMHGPS